MLLLVLACAVAGAIINVAVAWGCARFSEPRYNVPWPPTRLTAEDRAWWDSHAPTQFAKFASTEWVGLNLGSSRGTGIMVARMTGQHHELSGQFSHAEVCYQLSAGWPSLALTGYVWAKLKGDWSKQNQPFEYFPQWALLVTRSQPLFPGILPTHVFPIAPLWRGFAINTIFYTAILWLLFAAPGFVRRRIRARRGQCPACAYPIGTSPVCTECGKPVTPRG